VKIDATMGTASEAQPLHRDCVDRVPSSAPVTAEIFVVANRTVPCREEIAGNGIRKKTLLIPRRIAISIQTPGQLSK
jgi:hypothetical protein